MFEIRSLSDLEGSSAVLAKANQEIANNISSLRYILSAVQSNWQNAEGADIESIIEELNSCISDLENVISPTISSFVTAINNLASDSRENQRRTVEL